MTRGQLSIEIFFTLTLFIFVIITLNNLTNLAYSQSAPALEGQRRTVESLAALGSDACAANASISTTLPCILSPTSNVTYTLSFSTDTLSAASDYGTATANAMCNFTGTSIQTSCSDPRTICLAPSVGQISVTEGTCT